MDIGDDIDALPGPSLVYSYSTATHAPFNDLSANILTIGIDGYKAQIAFAVSKSNPQTKVRTSHTDEWSDWRSVALA